MTGPRATHSGWGTGLVPALVAVFLAAAPPADAQTMITSGERLPQVPAQVAERIRREKALVGDYAYTEPGAAAPALRLSLRGDGSFHELFASGPPENMREQIEGAWSLEFGELHFRNRSYRRALVFRSAALDPNIGFGVTILLPDGRPAKDLIVQASLGTTAAHHDEARAPLRGGRFTLPLRERRTPSIVYVIAETRDGAAFELRSFVPDIGKANSYTFTYTPMTDEPFDLRGTITDAARGVLLVEAGQAGVPVTRVR